MIDFDGVDQAELIRKGKLSLLYMAIADNKKSLAARCSETVSAATRINTLVQDGRFDDAAKALEYLDGARKMIGEHVANIAALAAQRDAIKREGDL